MSELTEKLLEVENKRLEEEIKELRQEPEKEIRCENSLIESVAMRKREVKQLEYTIIELRAEIGRGKNYVEHLKYEIGRRNATIDDICRANEKALKITNETKTKAKLVDDIVTGVNTLKAWWK